MPENIVNPQQNHERDQTPGYQASFFFSRVTRNCSNIFRRFIVLNVSLRNAHNAIVDIYLRWAMPDKLRDGTGVGFLCRDGRLSLFEKVAISTAAKLPIAVMVLQV